MTKLRRTGSRTFSVRYIRRATRQSRCLPRTRERLSSVDGRANRGRGRTGNRNESISQKPRRPAEARRPSVDRGPGLTPHDTRLGPISGAARAHGSVTACGYPPRATRVAPKVDKYRRSAALTGAPVECGVRRSTPGGPAELQKAPARGMAPAMAIPGDQFQPFAVLRFAPVAFRFASRGICAGHRRATTSATTSATTPDVPLSRAVPQSARCRLLAAAGPAPPDVIGRSAPVPLCLVRRLLGS